MNHRKQRIRFCIIYLALGIMISTLSTSPSFALSVYSERIAVGNSHTLLIDAEGNVWAFGNNSDGQLGDGSTASKDVPVMVYSNSWSGKAMSVAAGTRQSLALLEDGTVLMWGYGSAVQKAGIQEKAAAIAAGENMCMAILKTGEGVCWNDTSGPLPIKTESGARLAGIKEIAAGRDNFLILRAGTDNSVYQLRISSGNDYWIASKVVINNDSTPSPSPSLDDPSPSGGLPVAYLKNAVSISAGTMFGVALLNTYEVYTWGTNTENGVLGHGTVGANGVEQAKKVNGLTSIQKISAGPDHVIVVNAAGNAFGWGNARDKRLDAEKTANCYSSPEPLALSGISQFDCGPAWNVLMNGAGEFYIWGNNRGIEKLTLKQTLLKTPTPSVTASMISDQTMTITWNPQEYYTEMSSGFMITYTMPDGTAGKTRLLPLTSPQITLRGLQAATNYKIRLSIIGKTGFEEMAPEFVVQTAKSSDVSSSLESSSGSVLNPTNTQGAKMETSSSSGEDNQAKGGIYSLFNLIMIILIILALAFAVIAFIYIWKRLDKGKLQKIKPIRVSPGMEKTQPNGVEKPAEHGPPREFDGDPETDDLDMKIIPGKKQENPLLPDSEEGVRTESGESTKSMESGGTGESEDFLYSEDEATEKAEPEDDDEEDNNGDNGEDGDGDGFLTRLPNPHQYENDEEDFIIRKPGEPPK